MTRALRTSHQISALELERIAALGWQGTTVEQLGDWLLRAGSGFTGRANSVLPLGDPGVPLNRALENVRDFYRRHELPVIIQLPGPGSGSSLAALATDLGARGWGTQPPVSVMVADLTAMLESCPPHPVLPAAELTDRPSAAWLEGYLYRGTPLPPAAVEVLVNARRPVFASVTDSSGQAGVARGVVDQGWLGVTAVTVAQDRRRSGVGRHLVGELARWAITQQAKAVYLQVDSGNHPALTLYRSIGFIEHHTYTYCRPPG